MDGGEPSRILCAMKALRLGDGRQTPLTWAHITHIVGDMQDTNKYLPRLVQPRVAALCEVFPVAVVTGARIRPAGPGSNRTNESPKSVELYWLLNELTPIELEGGTLRSIVQDAGQNEQSRRSPMTLQ